MAGMVSLGMFALFSSLLIVPYLLHFDIQQGGFSLPKTSVKGVPFRSLLPSSWMNLTSDLHLLAFHLIPLYWLTVHDD